VLTDAIMGFFFGLFNSLSTWMNTHLPAAPTFWTDMTAALSTLNSSTSATVQYFLPIGPAVAAGIALTALIVLLGFIRLVRRAVSLFTGGGGAA
jgi:hypothetical protein